MTLVTVVCLRLQAMEPPSGWGPTSSVLAIVVTLGIAGTMLVDDPRLEPLVLTMGTIGIMAVTWRLADIAETLVEPLLAHRWVLAAKWQVASACVLGLFIGVAEAAGSLEGDPDAVFEWAIASPVGLVALILFMAVGVLASGFWLRAAWVTWRTLD